MKKTFGLLLALITGAIAMAQPTPHEKEVVKNDLVKERNKRHEVARDIARGERGEARADHRAAVYYHKKAHRDIRQVHRNEAARRRYHPHYVRHHRRYYHHRRPVRHHAKVVVEVRH